MSKFYARLLRLLVPILLLCQFSFAQNNDFERLRPLLVKNAATMGITTADIGDAVITHAYTDERTHITFVYMQQAYQHVKVYNTIISAAFVNNSLQYSSGSFVKNIAAKAGAASPVTSFTSAIGNAARHLGVKDVSTALLRQIGTGSAGVYRVAADAIARRPIETQLYWTASDDKQKVVLTWNVNIDLKSSDNWWNVRVNAQTGEVVQKDNWTVEEQAFLPDHIDESIASSPAHTFTSSAAIIEAAPFVPEKITTATNFLAPPPNVSSATYRVISYPNDSYLNNPFSNETSPWLMAGAGNNATTLGWHYDNTTNYNITRGNNVFAYLDKDVSTGVANTSNAATNWPDTSTTAAPALTFVNTLDFTKQPDSTSNKKAALDNLFYWNNLMHDVMYQYGLTEVAGNFQADNMSRGGVGNDFVNAQAQDGAGLSNANFSTPTDGTNGRMRMYLFSTSPRFTINTPAGISGDYAAIESGFSTANKLKTLGPLSGEVISYNNTDPTVHDACTAASNAAQLSGKIALIYATGCTFISKVKNAQNAGAIGAILYYTASNPFGMGGSDNTITIPTVSIGNATATSILNQINASVPVTVTISPGIYKDGDLDNGVITHEYGHGVSNRLTGGPFGSSCLANAEQGGEGWSDYIALMMTTNWSTATTTDGTNARPIGNYVLGYPVNGPGIRRYPYSTDMSVDPLTYANMAASTEVHNIGEIWCSALWDMTWNIIQQQNSITTNLYNSSGTGGNSIALNLVMTGMKLQPCSPGYIDARNAILAADSILYGYAHRCAIWTAFARRGMGAGASQGSATSAIDQVAATDLPSGVKINHAGAVAVNANSQITFSNTATCDCQTASFTLVDTIPAGFTYVSSTPTGVLSGNVLTFPATSFNASESKVFSVTLQTPATGCDIDSLLNDNRDANTTGGFVSSGTSSWTSSAQRSNTGSSWYSPDSTTPSTASLTSSITAATSAKPLSTLSFNHYFRTETTYDGGVVEYSTDGTTWIDAAPLFITGGYNTAMDASTVLTGRKAFSGSSQVFQPVVLDLSSLGTTPVQFRFRMTTDDGTGVEGWYVDDIVRLNGCGNIMRTGIYDNSNVRRDTSAVPMFVANLTNLPLTLLWFYAGQAGTQVALNWSTVTEVNVRNFSTEWSTDGISWTSLGNTAAQNRNSNSYSFVHTYPSNGKNYYRLKMNDADGRYTYSPIRTVTFDDKSKTQVILMPNPVSGDALLYMSTGFKASDVKMYDAAGSLVKQWKLNAGSAQLRISTYGLANGIYTIEVTGTGKTTTRMVVRH